ncbi:MAG TPA: glycerol-3-phosphate dehydrogenase/oxidase [Cerasibacillus sp.]|uniref:glycerol-3-phosphate dehydrogenase/oxidase n=1 Tax=Cerasibacillus sp. TaxID=2498711 RepID=UPI002F40FF7B
MRTIIRDDMLCELKKEEKLDLLVIGGGITGAGIALDATTRGLKTAVVDMQDFAAGTSSRSTKLVHGGLRYLKGLEFKLVAEVGKERAVVYENGPHVTTPEWMMLPFHTGGTFGPVTTNIGLRLYDTLAGVKKTERRQMLNRDETLAKEPLLKEAGLKGAGYYVEYKTDDARLTIEIMKKAVDHGAIAVNYLKVTNFIYDHRKVIGVHVLDLLTGKTEEIYAKKIVNACGPWVDDLRELDESKRGKHLYITKGIHLVFSNDVFPLQQAIYFDAPDGRMIFAIPRDGKTYVGTTDTPYDNDIAHPTATAVDRDYILNAIQNMFPTLSLAVDDVESSWAGLRPLIAEDGKKPDEISRKDEIFHSDSGLLSIAGGKLTGYRKMAEQIVDIVVKQFKEEEGILYSSSMTKDLPISGGEVGGSIGFQDFKVKAVGEAVQAGICEKDAERLVKRYGANVNQIINLYKQEKETDQHQEIAPLVLAELTYGIANEWVCRPIDFFIRRTGALFFDIDWVREHKQSVCNHMAKIFEWTTEEHKAAVNELDKAIQDAVAFPENE